jgi:hypothetical protein
VIDICQLCDDGSCADPIISCNDDGSCGGVTWECPTGECKTDADCGEYDGEAPCISCAADSSDPSFAPPIDPLPPTLVCPVYQCVESTCKVKQPSCDSYDPCAGKANGDACTACPPDDPACIETDVLKVCDGGKCVNAVTPAQ